MNHVIFKNLIVNLVCDEGQDLVNERLQVYEIQDINAFNDAP